MKVSDPDLLSPPMLSCGRSFREKPLGGGSNPPGSTIRGENMVEEPENYRRNPIGIYWSRLLPVDSETPFNRECPFCDKGILPVTRDRETLRVQAQDTCLYCGQHVVYLDYHKLQKLDGFTKGG